MNAEPTIPSSIKSATAFVRQALTKELSHLTSAEFSRYWNAIAYLHPELHPDSDTEEWPLELRPVHREACRRVENHRLSTDEFYPSDAQWCGLFDRLRNPTAAEIARRRAFSDPWLSASIRG